MADAKAKGWKTYLAAICAMLIGLGLAGQSVASGEFQANQIVEGLLTFTGGLALLGLGHKIQKLIEAVSGQLKAK